MGRPNQSCRREHGLRTTGADLKTVAFLEWQIGMTTL
jgi:hypothetical protein